MVDAASGWMELVPLFDESSAYIAHAFFDVWVARYGLPKAFMADNHPYFLNKMLDSLWRVMRVKKLDISGYRPQTNGKVERLNAYINQQMRQLAYKLTGKWHL